MTTVIRATGVSFNNQNLTKISPMVSDGLVAAFRPSQRTADLTDLSGNGHTLTQRGAPELTEFGVKGTATDGFITDVAETADLTLMCIARTHKHATDNEYDGFAVGAYNTNTASIERGAGLWFSQTVNASDLDIHVNAQTHVQVVSDSSYSNKNIRIFSPVENAGLGLAVSPWVFFATTLDSNSGLQKTYAPSQSTDEIQSYDHTANGFSLANRLLEDPNTLEKNLFQIASTPDDSLGWKGGIEVAEVLIFDKVLSKTQVLQQYLYSQEFMQKHRGISI